MDYITQMPAFENVVPALARALTARGFEALTAVQSAVLSPDVQSEDLVVSAQTGSGKTVAFGLTLANTLLDGQAKLAQAGAPQALIIAPTRELAMQVRGELEWLYAPTGGRIASCVGGMDMRDERRALNARRPHRRRHARTSGRSHPARLARDAGLESRRAR